MAFVLTRFVHRNCALSNVAGCTTVEAVDFGTTEWDFQITPNVVNSITAAAKTHVMNIHKAKDVTIKLLAAFIVWQGGGNSSNLLVMDANRARRQIRLALDRGCDDRLHVEFLAKINDESTAANGNSVAGSSHGEAKTHGWET
ncbi:hypothetical protein O1611_g6092 [Lasiodiplodia mahajangana]|uniref:Uncharacterized protein n=1 Tax=Lasiodiplodia mahajangana TaxID=1108764 RepID=A0ACC2JJT2_9PEZI|nr:hypothetical protein O1611_g6092 [Lasiodiplodia mahajangana]